MIELIFIIILVLSLMGVGVILYRRMPDLVKAQEPSGDFQKVVISRIKIGAKKLPGVKDLSYEMYLQKILSRIRVLTLKTEHKTGSWLERLRQKNNQKNGSNNDDYWEELKKAKDGK